MARIGLLLIILLSGPVVAEPRLPKHLAVPGGVAIVNIPGQHLNKPQAYYAKRKVLVRAGKNNETWHAVVSLPFQRRWVVITLR